MNLTPLLCLALALPAAAGPAAAPAGGELRLLEQAQQTAYQAVDRHKALRRQVQKDLERLKKDLRYISEELDRETLGPPKDLQSYADGSLERLRELRRRGNLDAKLAPVLDQLEGLFTGLPGKTYAEEYRRSLVRAVSSELRWAAEEAKAEKELLALLKDHLVVPDLDSGEEDAFQSLALFPVDLPLDKFLKLGPIRIWLVKHRIKRPKTHVRTTAPQIVAGKHNVQAGAEIEGVVTATYNAFDQDYCFDMGALHIEMTPEWRLLHPNIYKPKVGDHIRVRGWTYYDSFHKAEGDYDAEDPLMGANRVTLWEVHPVQDVELLP